MLMYPQLAGLYELDDIFAGGHVSHCFSHVAAAHFIDSFTLCFHGSRGYLGSYYCQPGWNLYCVTVGLLHDMQEVVWSECFFCEVAFLDSALNVPLWLIWTKKKKNTLKPQGKLKTISFPLSPSKTNILTQHSLQILQHHVLILHWNPENRSEECDTLFQYQIPWFPCTKMHISHPQVRGKNPLGILKLIDVPDQGEVPFGLCVTLIFSAGVLLLPLKLPARSQPKFFLF